MTQGNASGKSVVARRILTGLRYLSRGDLAGLARGLAELWQGRTKKNDRRDLREILKYVEPIAIEAEPLATETDIVIAVYNGLEFLPKLFESIQQNTTSPYRLIVVDDCSPDPQVKPFLEAAVKRNPNGLLLHNNRNLGFVESVNRAVQHARSDFVLLNTDVEVPPGWLERLMAPVVKDCTVASTTPFTNAGTICSFPVINHDNELPYHSTVDQADAAFRHVRAEGLRVELPTGIGFCMGIRRAVWIKIGGFDTVFGRGYGEENDWCQRANAAGFTNVLVPNLFVYHKHGGSFRSAEKQKLEQQNLQILRERYPNYDRKVRKFIDADPIAGLRDLLAVFVGCYASPTAIFLVIDHQLGGGANAYRRRVVTERLENGQPVLVCAPNTRDDCVYDLDYLSQYGNAYFSFSDLNQLAEMARYLRIDEIMINNLVGWPKPMSALAIVQEIKHETGARMTLSVHDFFSLCPSYNLLNEKAKFCNLPNLAYCQRCLPQNPLAHNPESTKIETWRSRWQKLIDQCEEVLCFSESSLSLVRRIHNLRCEHMRVRPHDVNVRFAKKPRISFEHGLHIGVVGAINYAKGAAIVSEIVKLIDAEPNGTRLSVIGAFDGWLRGRHVKVTGPYDPDKLPSLLKELGINICFLPSVWPETFSYVTSELIALGMPLCCFDLGAPAERVRNYDKGLVIGNIDAALALAEIRRFYEVLKKKSRQSDQLCQ